MHPDVNKNENAHEQFVLLNEAYEYLINVESYGSTSTDSSSQNYQWTQQDWQEQQRENAKERAREYARMRYSEFIKSDYYKEQKVVDTVTTHLLVLFSILLLTLVPIIMLSILGIEAIVGIAIINIVLLPIHLQAYQNLRLLNFKEFRSSFGKLFQISSFQIVSLLLINVLLVVKVVGNTLASTSFVLSAYSIAILLFLILTRTSKIRKFMSFAVGPTIVTMLFFINYLFAAYPTQQKFKIVSNGYSQESSMITLADRQLEKYPGIRIFYDYQEVRDAEEVVYTFEYGILGLIVMTDYYFINN